MHQHVGGMFQPAEILRQILLLSLLLETYWKHNHTIMDFIKETDFYHQKYDLLLQLCISFIVLVLHSLLSFVTDSSYFVYTKHFDGSEWFSYGWCAI